MKNVVIIGQSPLVHAAVKAILDRDPSAAITLISCDGHLPYDRTLLPGLIDRSVREQDVFCAPADFYKEARVELILDKQISRINFNRKRIFLSEKAQVDFDGLILADAPDIRLPQLKGIRRQGVFHLARLDAVKALVAYLTFTETALIEPLGFTGIKAALALKAVGKDVIVTTRQGTLLSGILSPDRGQALVRALEKRGIRFIPGGIEDVIGETELKAVRLKSGKVVACDMVVTEDVAPDLRFLDDTGLLLAQRVIVTGPMRTNTDGVYALDAMAQVPEPSFVGAYALSPQDTLWQAGLAVAGLWGEASIIPDLVFEQRDILGTFFHPEELAPVIPEITA